MSDFGRLPFSQPVCSWQGIQDPSFGMITAKHQALVIQVLEGLGNGIVVDLGVGETNIERKAKYSRAYYGIDTCIQAMHSVKDSGNILLIAADAKLLPLKSETCDLVLAFGLFGELDTTTSGNPVVIQIENQLRLECPDYDNLPLQESVERLQRELLRTLPERAGRVVREVYRILRPGGTFIVSNNIIRQPPNIFLPFFDAFSAFELYTDVERYLVVARR